MPYDFIVWKGFGDIGIRPEDHAFADVDAPAFGGQEDHLDVAPLGIEFDDFAHFIAVNPRQHDIQQNEGRFILGDDFDRLFAALGNQHFVAVLFDQKLEGNDYVGFVIDDQYFGSHVGSRL